MAGKTYMSDRPCSQGHTERYLKNNMCAPCNRERARKQREETDPTAIKAYKENWYRINIARIKKQHKELQNNLNLF